MTIPLTVSASARNAWPDIPYEPWRETCSALHLYTQIVGKYRLARTPWLNHSWHAILYVSARGFTTALVPDEAGGVEIAFDLHRARGRRHDHERGQSGVFSRPDVGRGVSRTLP